MDSGSREPTELIDPRPERQARDKFRGYAYQAYQTILAWLHCKPDEQILCEFGEDIAIVRRDAAGDVSSAELDQFKHEKARLTLNTETARKAINSLLEHRASNPWVRLFLRVCTIAERGREKIGNWKYARCGLDLWDRIRDDPDLPKDALGLLRHFLVDQPDLSKITLDFIKTASDSELHSDLVDRIFWDTGEQSYSEVQGEISRLLSTMSRPVTDPDELDAIVNRLWRDVTERMAAQDPRPLTQQDLQELLRRETTAQIDRRVVIEMAGSLSDIKAKTARIETMLAPMIGAVPTHGSSQLSLAREAIKWQTPPPLSDLCSARGRIVKDLIARANGKALVWIHGWTGAGKSTLANLFVRALNEQCLWFSLRDLGDFSLSAAFGQLLDSITQFKDINGLLVYDDVNAEQLSARGTELILRSVDLIRDRNLKVVITSPQEPPSRLRSDIAASLYEFLVPSLEEDEIKEIIRLAGLDREPALSKWASYISAITAGHPQLACARILQAKQNYWKLAIDQFFQEPRTVEHVKAEARKTLATSIAFDEARELARRLSVISGVFTREFALRLSSAPPPLNEPGRAFDFLVGPWIERIAQRRFAISPLLAGYAQAEFGDSLLPRYFGIAAHAWLGERVFTPAQVTHAAASAVLGSNEKLLVKLSAWLTTEDTDTLTNFARDVSFFIHLCPANDTLLNFSLPTRFIFRQAQMRVAALNSDWERYINLDALVMELLREPEAKAFVDGFRLYHFVSTNLRRESPLPFYERLSRALAVLQLEADRSISKYIPAVHRARYPITPIGMMASLTAKTPDDLESWLQMVQSADPSVRALVFKGFDTDPDSYSLFLGHVWQTTSKAATPNWETCLNAFQAVCELGKSTGNASLVAACVEASMVVLDELLGDRNAATALAAQAREGGWDHPLVDLEEAMIAYRAGDDVRAIRYVEEVERRAPEPRMIVKRLFALGNALRSGSRLRIEETERITRLRWIAERGKEISQNARREIFGRICRLAFTAELAWLAHQDSDYSSAVRDFDRVLQVLQRDDQTEPLIRSLRLRFGHVIGWLSQGAIKNDLMATPFSGIFANFETPSGELLSMAGASYPMLWSALAEYAALVGETKDCRRFVRRASSRGEQEYYLVALQSAGASFLCDLIDGKLERALLNGIQCSRVLSLGGILRSLESESFPASEPINLSRLLEENASRVNEQCRENTPAYVLAPIFMGGCANENVIRPKFQKLERQIRSAIGINDLITKGIYLLATGFRAVVDEEPEAIREIRGLAENAGDVDEGLRILPLVACCALNAADLRDLLKFQVTILLDSAFLLRGTYWTAAFCRMVAARWKTIAERYRFRFSDPRVMPDAIIRTASARMFNLPHGARLLLTVAAAIGANWHQSTLERLHEISTLDS